MGKSHYTYVHNIHVLLHSLGCKVSLLTKGILCLYERCSGAIYIHQLNQKISNKLVLSFSHVDSWFFVIGSLESQP